MQYSTLLRILLCYHKIEIMLELGYILGFLEDYLQYMKVPRNIRAMKLSAVNQITCLKLRKKYYVNFKITPKLLSIPFPVNYLSQSAAKLY